MRWVEGLASIFVQRLNIRWRRASQLDTLGVFCPGQFMSRDYVERILRARVYDVAREARLDPMSRLSRRIGNQIMLKREDLQAVFSFKLRGAYNKISGLSDEERGRGVVASSAGNHAQGVALAARKLGVDAVIVMPATAPAIKVEAVRELGAKVELYGGSYDDAKNRSLEIAEQQNRVMVHPFDDPDVIAGQGTVAMEIIRQLGSELDAIFVPVGGGGLIAGISVYVKALWPQIRIIGVEPEEAASMHHSLAAGRRVELESVGIFADGVAVKKVGKETFRLAQQFVDEVILVSTDEICAAIKDIYEDTRSISEPAGALAVAGLKRYAEREGLQNSTLVAVDSGANVNFDRLRHIAERASIGEQSEALLAVTIPERVGAFRDFCALIGNRSVTEFNYRYADAQRAHIFVGVELLKGRQEKQEIIDLLEAQEYPVFDMSDDEMAKIHVRYMVGGRAQGAPDECLYRFNFPERPGALLDFLTRMGRHWNISLFHYRNHGSDYGRVLVGLQVPEADTEALQQFLDELGYDYQNESENPAYKLFLRAF